MFLGCILDLDVGGSSRDRNSICYGTGLSDETIANFSSLASNNQTKVYHFPFRLTASPEQMKNKATKSHNVTSRG